MILRIPFSYLIFIFSTLSLYSQDCWVSNVAIDANLGEEFATISWDGEGEHFNIQILDTANPTSTNFSTTQNELEVSVELLIPSTVMYPIIISTTAVCPNGSGFSSGNQLTIGETEMIEDGGLIPCSSINEINHVYLILAGEFVAVTSSCLCGCIQCGFDYWAYTTNSEEFSIEACPLSSIEELGEEESTLSYEFYYPFPDGEESPEDYVLLALSAENEQGMTVELFEEFMCEFDEMTWRKGDERKLITTSSYLFPNPCQDLISIKPINFDQGAIFTITNAFGKIVFRTLAQNSNLSINTSEFEPGLYFFIEENPNGVIEVSRFIKN